MAANTSAFIHLHLALGRLTGERRQLWCFAISATYYALFNVGDDNVLVGKPTRFGGLIMYATGLRDGIKAPVDRESRTFRQTSADFPGKGREAV